MHQNHNRFYRLACCILFVVLISGGNLSAQEKMVTGRITSVTESFSLPGVNVVVKGTTKGTVTNAVGFYSIDASPDDILLITSIGYVSQEIKVGNQTTIDVQMADDISKLDEVVVIGYGTQQKKLVTGATVHVNADELVQRNTISAMQALQGQTPGVNITSTSGQPGSSLKVNIRGLGTIGNGSPLYIVDGVQTSDINFLNPADIESIDILKDAASSAIYGSQAANGVVLVTTKRGQKGQSHITFDAYYGFQNIAKKVDMLNAEEYASIINEQFLNSGGTAAGLPFDVNNLPAYTDEGVANTDWINEMNYKNAVTQNYVFGASGGNAQSIYSMSLSYTGQEGIFGGPSLSNYDRIGGRFNSEYNFFDGLINIGQNLSFAHTDSKNIQVGNQYYNSLRPAFQSSPLLPVYDNNGNFFNVADKTILDQFGQPYWNDQELNPYGNMYFNNQNTTNTQKFIGSVYADVNFLKKKNLVFHTMLGIDYFNTETRTFTPIYELSVYTFSNFSKATQMMNKGMEVNWNNLLTYTYDWGKSNIVVMGGMQLQKYNSSWMYGENVDVAFNDLEHAWLNNALNTDNAALIKIQGAPWDPKSHDPKNGKKMLSYFGRIQYGYADKYLLNATFRADGSSKFAKGNRWGYFPSVSAGWVMTSESFMQEIRDVVTFLKIRASWGQNGNSNIKSFQYLAPIKFTQALYNFGDQEGVSASGSYPSMLSNEKVKWETSQQLDFGFDSQLWDGLLIVTFDWYNKQTKDWLIPAPIYATAGTDAPFINGGDVINKGVELALSTRGNRGDFQYQIGVNGSYNKNHVQNVPTDDGIIHGATNILYANSEEFYRAESGHAIGYFWGWQTNGLFQNSAEVSQYVNADGKKIQPNAKPGDLKYVDQNGDGIINDQDKVDLGDPNPDFSYGINFSCNWRGFNVLVAGYGVQGNEIVQSYRDQSNKYSNYTTDILDRWHGEGTSNSIPRVTDNNINYKFSDIYVKDGSFFRINNVTLGYDFARLVQAGFLSKLRIYASVLNLYTFTKYSGMDPEIGYGNESANDPSDRYSSGIDLGYYPSPRTFLFGLNVKF
ncbi:MAG: SusC/RagA family TonB-linked outer membrane protein [Bacteroidetes bacterium CG_4_9_14_3_um_filter_41_19]|nr:MAG: SusC/RagA family TonB-linked outer membrane protein [Bacteroidetes bacterium CG_4_9_14_3_um_filter_41_19]